MPWRTLTQRYFRPSAQFTAQMQALVVLGPAVAATALLPLSALLLMLPAFLRDETVLTDASAPPRSVFHDLSTRLFALAQGLAVLIALIVAAVELSGRLPIDPSLRWPIGILLVYAADLLVLLAVGRVPLAYNVRNLLTRWKTTLLTALAFTVVVALLTVMLAFVGGMERMSENSGKPGNVVVLSDGALDEIFSSFDFSSGVNNVERVRVTLDQADRPLATPVTVGTVEVEEGGRKQEKFLLSRETYVIANQAVAPGPGLPPKRRFIQVRGIYDPVVAGMVHDIELLPGGQWFSPAGVDDQQRIQVVMGEGAATIFGAGQGKPALQVGDGLELGPRTCVVTGIMKAEGSTFGSEIWAKQELVGETFRKKTTSTVVLRVADPSEARGALMAHELRNRFNVKVQALTEPEYYAKLGQTNKQFLIAILFVAAVMAVGGIFGVMNTMFAAIAQRTKDIGVLRILGFKRWQLLVSFMLESLAIALIGGVIGCALGYLADGFTAQSILSSGQGGGGKFVVLRLVVDTNLLLTGIVFAIVMGRLGGLVPALSAMRLKMLDALR